MPIPFHVQLLHTKVRVVLKRESAGAPFHAKWWYKGKAYHRSTKAFTETKARAAAKKLVEDEARVGIESMELQAAVDACLLDRFPVPIENNSHGAKTRDMLNLFAARVGPKLRIDTPSFDALTDMVQGFIDWLKKKKKLAPQTCLNAQRILSRFFKWMIKARLITARANPASKLLLELEPVFRTPKPPIRADDLKTFLIEAKKTPAWGSVLLCLSAGLRPSGSARIEWTDINLEAGTMQVTEKRKPRNIPLNTWVVTELKEWKKTHKRPVAIGLDMLHEWLRRIRKANKLGSECTLQGCRRTFISMCMDAGISADVVAGVAGNSAKVIQMHYKDLGTLKAQHVAEAMNLSGLFSASPDKKADK